MIAEFNIKGDLHCADLITGGQHITYGFSADDVERLIEKVFSFLTAGAQFVPEANGRVRVELDGESLTFRPGAAKLLAGQRNERSYLLSLTVHQDYLIWATNFIPLKANVDKQRAIAGLDVPLAFTEIRVPPPGSGPEAQITTEPLENITDAFDKHDAFIILGEPGAGKTTTLQKMVFDYALGYLEKRSNLIPFYARLSQQRESSPFEFLEKAWKKSTGSDFADALASGSVLLLLDGVNELPHEKRDERLNDWRLFAKQDCAVCKVAFSGREKDYQGSLDLPRVRVERLDEDRIADYLKRNQAEGLLDFLNAEDSGASRLRLLAENPLNLSLLAFYYRENGKSLDNRGKLFEWFAGALMAREKRDHPDNVPLEVRREALEKLAYTAQERGETPTLTPAIAKASLPVGVEYKGGLFPIDSDEFFNFARGAKLLDPAVESDAGKSFRLPTEMEWEAAARGLPDKPLLGAMKAQKYPWGDDWDKEKANSIESRVLKPSPVGAYAAAGAIGPFKAEDQAGNIWDWTSSLYLSYPFDEKSSEVFDAEGERVVRGGSWYNDRDEVRCACRLRIVPVYFSDFVGFRVVSPGSDIPAS